MPRINVEDDFWTHPRYRHLIRLVGDEDKAAGMCLRAWRIAQQYWATRKCIPFEVWQLECLDQLITVGLAERRDDGVHIRGAEKHFGWYADRIAASKRGGQKSAEARRKKFGSASPTLANKHSEANPKCTSKSLRRSPKQTRSTTSVFTEASSNPLTLYTADESQEPGGSDVWDAYSGAYFSRYNVPPVRNARVNAMCAQLVKRLGGDAAILVVRFYLTHNNAYYVTKSHALGPCLHDCEALHTQMKNGRRTTQSDAKQADQNDAQRQVFENVARKWGIADE